MRENMYVGSGKHTYRAATEKRGEGISIASVDLFYLLGAVEIIIVSVLLRSLAHRSTLECLNARPLGQPVSSSTVYSAFPHAVSPMAG